MYESDLGAENADDDPFRREITGQGGIMLAVTHIVDTGADDGLARQITTAMREAACSAAGSRCRPESQHREGETAA